MDNHGTLHPLLPRHGAITIICLASRSLLLMFDDESLHLRGSMLVIEDICLEASFWKTSFKKRMSQYFTFAKYLRNNENIHED